MLTKILEEERRKRGLTQAEVAEKIGISRPSYVYYETGKRNPKYDTLKKLADLFEITTDYLLGHSPDPDHTLDVEFGGFLNENNEFVFRLDDRQLVKLRNYHNLDIEKIAKELDIDTKTYLKYEEELSFPIVKKDIIEKLCLLFDVKINELVWSHEDYQYIDDEEIIEDEINNENYIVINGKKIEITVDEAEYITESLTLYRKLKIKK